MITIGDSCYSYKPTVRAKGRVVWVDDCFILLCDSEKIAEDLVRQAAKPTDDSLEEMNFRLGDTSKHPWKLDIGPHLQKIVSVVQENDEIHLSAKGLNSSDVAVLEHGGFEYSIEPNEYEDNGVTAQWRKGIEYPPEEVFDILEHSLEWISESLEDTSNLDDFDRSYFRKAKRLAEQVPDMYAQDGRLLSAAIRNNKHSVILELFQIDSQPHTRWVHLGNIAHRDGDTPLLNLILEQGVSDAELKNGLLVKHCREGDLQKVDELIQTGADIHWNDDFSLYVTCENGHQDIAELLCKNGASFHGDNAFMVQCVVRGGHMDLLRWLCESGQALNKDGTLAVDCPLFAGVASNDTEVVEYLLSKGANPEEYFEEEGTIGPLPIHEAVKTGHKGIVQALCNHDSIGQTINARAEVDLASDYEESDWAEDVTPLMLAVNGGWAEVAALLLINGAEVNAVNAQGKTALDYAVQRHNPEILGTLLEAGADPNITGEDEQTVLGRAALDLVAKVNYFHEVKGDEELMDQAANDLGGSELSSIHCYTTLCEETPVIQGLESASNGGVFLIDAESIMEKSDECRKIEKLLGTELTLANWASWEYMSSGLVVELEEAVGLHESVFSDWKSAQEEARKALRSTGEHEWGELREQLEMQINEILDEHDFYNCEVMALDIYPVRDVGNPIWESPWKLRLVWEEEYLMGVRDEYRGFYEDIGAPYIQAYGALSV